jgi:quercetin dioxygenase-like cupin family protein
MMFTTPVDASNTYAGTSARLRVAFFWHGLDRGGDRSAAYDDGELARDRSAIDCFIYFHLFAQDEEDAIMSVTHAQPVDAIGVLPAADAPHATKTVTLIKTTSLEVIRLVLPAGKQLANHCVPGEITLQCLVGAATLEADGRSCELAAGTMAFLSGGVAHSLAAKTDATLLLTILLVPKG